MRSRPGAHEMSTALLDKLIWVLLYGGLLTICLALFVGRDDGPFGTLLAAAGVIATAVGALLIWVRSRRRR